MIIAGEEGRSSRTRREESNNRVGYVVYTCRVLTLGLCRPDSMYKVDYRVRYMETTEFRYMLCWGREGLAEGWGGDG